MDDRLYNAMRRMVKALDNPKASLYFLLLEQLRPLSRKELLKLTKYDEATLDRTLRFLFQKKLVEKRELRHREIMYFATL